MTWIKTLLPTENEAVHEALGRLVELYPQEYAPERRAERKLPDAVKNDSMMLSHSLLPQTMLHAFSTFGSLMDPSLPLSRRQHEMIATTVSTTNSCCY